MSNLLISALKLLSMEKEDQMEYINGLFNDNDNESIEEILLEYDDAKYLIDNYKSNDMLKEMFISLDIIINEIDDNKLFYKNDLDNLLWDKARIKARDIIKCMKYAK